MTVRVAIAAILALAPAGCGGPAPAPAVPSGFNTAASNADSYVVAWQSDPRPIPIGEPFSLVVTVFDMGGTQRPIEDATVQVTARMPEHERWMEARPSVKRAGPGRYIADGLVFDMEGNWEMYFDVTRAGVTERAEFQVRVQRSAISDQ